MTQSDPSHSEPSSRPQSLLLRARYRVEVWALKGGMALVERLPRRVMRWLGWAVGAIVYLADAKGRHTAMENLRCVFPDKSLPERRKITRKSYQHMTWTFFDLFWGLNLNRENWHRYARLVLEDPEAFEEARRTGAIWITAHFGNFEWLALIFGLNRPPLQVVAQSFNNSGLTPIFQSLREHSGNSVIPQQRAMLRLYKSLRRGGHTAMLTDLNVDLAQSPAVIDCFGMKTCVTTVHVLLAGKCQVPVVPVLGKRKEDGCYDLKFGKSIAIAEETPSWLAAQQCWDAFEPIIRESPEQWLWMYKHWRYRPADADEVTYPAYANPKRKFDRILSAQRSQSL